MISKKFLFGNATKLDEPVIRHKTAAAAAAAAAADFLINCVSVPQRNMLQDWFKPVLFAEGLILEQQRFKYWTSK